jgi:Holliday junction resolvasome RuvABC endonuclease subunit
MTTTTNLTVAGIDYSMTLPCICLHDNYGYHFHYLTSQKKYHLSLEHDDFTVTGHVMPLYDDDLDRWDKISDWALEVMYDWDIDICVLEDYSFASTGRTFQIGEHFGLLKYKMKRSIIPFKTVPPTVLKKFATGKGNAKKELLNDQFILETEWDVKKALQQTDKQWNPSSDIIDSYYLAEWGKQYEMDRKSKTDIS